MNNPDRLVILAVEDEEDDRLLLQRAFDREGIRVPIHFVFTGEQAIDYLQGTGAYADRAAHPFPNLLLLDLNLPRVDGFEILEWLRARPGLRLQVLVVIVSASNDPLIMQKANRLGADIFLSKAEGPNELMPMVRRLKQLLEREPKITVKHPVQPSPAQNPEC